MAPTSLPTLPARMTLGAVHLIVSDLDRSVAWYQRSLGLRVHAQDTGSASLGDGTATVLVLHEDPLARPAGRHAGLYHYALLYPSREELARAAVRLSVTSTAIDGASDHRTHEAIYLGDPDGNGIELAADRPRTDWPPTSDTPAARPRSTSARCWPRSPGRRPRRTSARACAWATCTCTSATSTRASPSTATPSASSCRPTSARPPSSRPAATTTIWASTSGAAAVSARPRRTRPGCATGPIVLPTTADVAAVRARVGQAEDVPGGFLTHDPWQTAVAVLAQD